MMKRLQIRKESRCALLTLIGYLKMKMKKTKEKKRKKMKTQINSLMINKGKKIKLNTTIMH